MLEPLDRFWDLLQSKLGDRVVLNGHPSERLPNTLNVSFVARVGAEVLAGLPGVAASSGSACHSGSVELSPGLTSHGRGTGDRSGCDSVQSGPHHDAG